MHNTISTKNTSRILRRSIIIGITTAPRKIPTIVTSLDSCCNAFDKDNIFIFSEPNVYINTKIKVIYNKEILGCWKNWCLSLYRLYDMFPKKDYYAIFQDDVIYARNIQNYLDKIDLPPIFSIFKPQHYLKNNETWAEMRRGQYLWMAQTLFFRNDIAKLLVKDSSLWKFDGDKQVDNRVGLFAEKHDIPVSYHVPSLCQHIGDTSSIWNNGVAAEEDRAANDFVGESFDCLKLLSLS